MKRKKVHEVNQIKKLVDVSQLDLDEWKRYNQEEVQRINIEWAQVIFVDNDVCFKPVVGGINTVYQELYNVCEALGSISQLSYEEWIAAVEWIAALKGLREEEVIDQWNKERRKREQDS